MPLSISQANRFAIHYSPNSTDQEFPLTETFSPSTILPRSLITCAANTRSSCANDIHHFSSPRGADIEPSVPWSGARRDRKPDSTARACANGSARYRPDGRRPHRRRARLPPDDHTYGRRYRSRHSRNNFGVALDRFDRGLSRRENFLHMAIGGVRRSLRGSRAVSNSPFCTISLALGKAASSARTRADAPGRRNDRNEDATGSRG